MKLPIYQVDAFTSEVFCGNPAAVVLMEKPLPEATMQSVAAENNLSETAYLLLGKEPLELRWFTPKVEVDLCGHATLATAHVLFEQGLIKGDRVEFKTQSGRLTVTREGDRLCLDFPSRPPKSVPLTEGMEAALGAPPVAAFKARSLLLEFAMEEQVAALDPHFDLVADLDEFAVIATAPGNEVDFVSRFFAPAKGVPEDPVTGSAHSTLIPFWSGKLNKKKMQARQISARGGELACEDRGDRVLISGRGVSYLEGLITL